MRNHRKHLDVHAAMNNLHENFNYGSHSRNQTRHIASNKLQTMTRQTMSSVPNCFLICPMCKDQTHNTEYKRTILVRRFFTCFCVEWKNSAKYLRLKNPERSHSKDPWLCSGNNWRRISWLTWEGNITFPCDMNKWRGALNSVLVLSHNNMKGLSMFLVSSSHII